MGINNEVLYCCGTFKFESLIPRFLQAITEHFNSVEEGAVIEREIHRLDEQLRRSRTEWKRERSQLVNVLTHIARQNVGAPDPVTRNEVPDQEMNSWTHGPRV